MELKSQQQGQGLSDWSMTRQKCEWSGVKCNEAGRVIELYLGSTGLGGTLPPQWSVLSDLKILFLDSNGLSGTLPPQWSLLRSLEVMGLHGNRLAGTLPQQWSRLVGLNSMLLYRNSLAGTLPRQWSRLRSLKEMSLWLNGFSGTLPRQWSELMGLDFMWDCGQTVVRCLVLVGLLSCNFLLGPDRHLTVEFALCQVLGKQPPHWGAAAPMEQAGGPGPDVSMSLFRSLMSASGFDKGRCPCAGTWITTAFPGHCRRSGAC